MRIRLTLLASLSIITPAVAQEALPVATDAVAPVEAPAIVAAPVPDPVPVVALAPAPVVVPTAVVAPVVAAAPVPATRSKDTSDVDFPDEDIRVILRNIADLYELNLVVPDTLQGRTTLKLHEVTWRQIFHVVLSPVGFGFAEDGNIIKIVSLDMLAQEPFVTQGVILDNVAAGSIEPLVKSILTPSQAATATAPGLTGGSIVVNALANELIITDKSAVVKRIIETVKRLDSEPRQVVIETKFVELTRDQSKSLGVSMAGKKAIGQGVSSGQGGFGTLGESLPGVSPSAVGSGTFNAVLNGSDYTLFLEAIETLDGARLVSSPTVVAVNGSKSEITIGTYLQLVTATQTAPTGGGTPTVTFTAGEKLFQGVKVDVTPNITSSKLVTLALKTEKSSATPFRVGSGGAAQTFYDLNMRSGSLNMILKDGQTAAIGGLMDTNDTNSESKVPLLGDIPVLGNLFKVKSKSKTDTNLIIFITANILEPSKTTYANIATKTQINELNLTDRDIQGVRYQASDEEKRLYAEADSMRKARQDAEIQGGLKEQTKKPKGK
jgi:type IV pilus assembly protein PilQ